MGNYVRILEEVEAVRATETNIEDLRKLSSNVQRITPTLGKPSYYIVSGLNEVVWVGDWLIKHKSGRLEVKSNGNFLMEYEPK